MVIVKIVRYPRTRPTHQAMAQEVGQEYQRLGADMTRDLHTMLGPTWSEKPRVTTVVKITRKRWMIQLKVDMRTRAGKKFDRVDRGTGIYGKKHRAYVITPKRAKALRFRVPHKPKTLPATYAARRVRSVEAERAGPGEVVFTRKVIATGIRPRRFRERLAKKYNNRRWTGGFYRRTENAARRGMRRGRRQYVTV